MPSVLPADEFELELRWLFCLEELYAICVFHVNKFDLDPLLLECADEARQAWARDLFDTELRDAFFNSVADVLEAAEAN